MGSSASALPLQNLLYEKKGPIAYVTINRPLVLNSLNRQTIAELWETFEDARDDSAIGGVILTGAGEKAFAAGADWFIARPDTHFKHLEIIGETA